MAHSLGHCMLRFIGAFQPPKIETWQPFTWRGLRFANRLGVAGGLDKNAHLLSGFWALGAGFLEIGTITPRAQTANLGKCFGRDNKTESVWNHLGFPNEGADKILQRLSQLVRPYPTPIFINIGKNRDTLLARAHEDYIQLIEKFSPIADAFVINISSPNTKDLRDLLHPVRLEEFLRPVIAASRAIPILLKLSPDVTNQELISCLEISNAVGISGWILTNTTLARTEGTAKLYPKEGGVSGRPLAARSIEMLKMAIEHLGDRREGKLIVSVGGVMSPQDVFDRLRLGAQLVQIYTALVFNGPKFFHEVSHQARQVE